MFVMKRYIHPPLSNCESIIPEPSFLLRFRANVYKGLVTMCLDFRWVEMTYTRKPL